MCAAGPPARRAGRMCRTRPHNPGAGACLALYSRIASPANGPANHHGPADTLYLDLLAVSCLQQRGSPWQPGVARGPAAGPPLLTRHATIPSEVAPSPPTGAHPARRGRWGGVAPLRTLTIRTKKEQRDSAPRAARKPPCQHLFEQWWALSSPAGLSIGCGQRPRARRTGSPRRVSSARGTPRGALVPPRPNSGA